MVNPNFTDLIDDNGHTPHVGVQQELGNKRGFTAAKKPRNQGHWYFACQRIARPSHCSFTLNVHFKNVQAACEAVYGVDNASVIDIHIIELNGTRWR